MSETTASTLLSARYRSGSAFPADTDPMLASAPHSTGGLWFIAIFLLIFLGIGLTTGFLQHYRLATYVPVKAEILSASISVSHSHSRHGSSTSYSPQISYRYTAGGITHLGTRVLAIGNVSASSSWARQFLQRYPVHSTATAYVSPNDPSEAFLDREVEFFPYIFALFPGLLYAFMIGTAISGQRRSNLAAIASGQWQVLHPSQPPKLLFRRAVLMASLWLGYVAILLGEYVFLRHGKIDLFTSIALLCAIAAAWVILHMPWKHYQAMQNYGSVDLSAGPGVWKPGGVVDARLSYDARNGAPLQDAAIGLLCLKSQWVIHGKNKQFQSIAVHHQEQPIALPYSSGMAAAETHLPIPPAIHATGHDGWSHFPRYDWFVGIRLHATDQAELVLRYPIRVDAAKDAAEATRA